MTIKRIEFKICDLFKGDQNGDIAVIRMLAACNDLNTIVILFVDKKVHENFEIKEIREGVHTYLFRIMISHLVEAKNAFSSFKMSSSGKDLLSKVQAHEVWEVTKEHYDRLVAFFENESGLFKLAQEKIRTGVGFHYLEKDFKEALIGDEGQKQSLIVLGETNKDTRYTFVDDIVASRVSAVLQFEETRYDELTKPIGSLNQFCSALLAVILPEHQDHIREV